jgi:hypothetical protein
LSGDAAISQKALQLSHQWNKQTICFQISADFSRLVQNPEVVLLDDLGIAPDPELMGIIRLVREHFEIPAWTLVDVRGRAGGLS